MSQENSWSERVQKVVADRAFTLNYQDGVQCRFIPVKSENGTHVMELLLEMTHSGHPFDIHWFVRFTDDPAGLIRAEIVAPPDEGGTLQSETYDSLERLWAEAQVLTAFIRGYFVGRQVAASRAQDEPATHAG